VTRATAAIGDLPIRGAVFRPRALAQLMAGPRSAHLARRRRTEKSPILRQAGTLPTVTGSVGSRCHAACATSDWVGADGIRASPEDVAAPVAVAPSSA
jgi:hypothetical protein